MKRFMNEAVLIGFAGIGNLFHARGIPVLCYHSVKGENQGSVSSASFYQQMQYLHEHDFSVISLSDLVKTMQSTKPVSGKSIALTFDDGYKSNYDTAYPVLKEFNFTATVFLTTGRIGGFSDWEGSEGTGGLPLMSWREIKEMSEDGIEFGAHSDTHLRLTRISIKDAGKEIGVSKARIEDATGKPARFFAYPYGDYNEEVKEIVRGFDFTSACTMKPGLNVPGQDLFALKRSGVFRDTSPAGLRTRLNGSFRWYFYGKKWVRGDRVS